MLNSGKTHHDAGMSRPRYWSGAVHARTVRGGPIQRGESSDHEGSGVCSVSSLFPHCKLHIQPVGVELGLASVLPLLQQHQHLRRHARHPMCRSCINVLTLNASAAIDHAGGFVVVRPGRTEDEQGPPHLASHTACRAVMAQGGGRAGLRGAGCLP